MLIIEHADIRVEHFAGEGKMPGAVVLSVKGIDGRWVGFRLTPDQWVALELAVDFVRSRRLFHGT